jgi:hypothetical protein
MLAGVCIQSYQVVKRKFRISKTRAAPKKIIVRPDVGELAMLIGRLQDIDDREVNLYGLRAPTKPWAVSTFVGQAMTDEELDRQLERLTGEEQDVFMTLIQKLQGRWLALLPSIETTAAPVEPS